MKTIGIRIATGLTSLALTTNGYTAAATDAHPVVAHASTAASTPSDPALPSYPGLPADGRASSAAPVSTTPTPCANNGPDKNMTRSQALTRAQSWLSEGIPYSQYRCYRNAFGDYRTDCSGFVSMAWGVGGSGSDHWTGNFLDISDVIARSDLQPGDALLRHTGDPDENHVALFVRWADQAHTQPIVMEQTGSQDTIEDTWTKTNAGLYTPVRYDHIVNESASGNGVVSGDVTGDGRADMIARKPDGTLSLYTNGGSNTAPYSTSIQIGIGWQQFSWFLADDVTGDGRADIVAAKPDGTLALYTNTGSNTVPYNAGIQIGTNWAQFRNVALADVTGDHRADLVTVGQNGVLSLYTNGGSNTAPYSTAIQIGIGWQQFTRVLAGDVTGDGRADIVAAKPDGTLALYTNTGSNTVPYNAGIQIGTNWAQFRNVALADVTGDHRADLVTVGQNGVLSLYTNGGSNTAPYNAGIQIGIGWQNFV